MKLKNWEREGEQNRTKDTMNENEEQSDQMRFLFKLNHLIPYTQIQTTHLLTKISKNYSKLHKK